MSITRRILLLPMLCLVVACGSDSGSGSGDTSQAATSQGGKSPDMTEPPDAFQRLGMPASELPLRWIESTGPGGGKRDYFEGVYDFEGDDSVRGVLIITDDLQSKAKRFEFTDLQLRSKPSGGLSVVKKVTTSGTLTSQILTGKKGVLNVHRLQGETLREQARTLVRFPDRMQVAGKPLEDTEFDRGIYLGHYGTALPQQVEITNSPMDILNWKVHLRVGDTLVARLTRLTSQAPHKLHAGSEGDQLKLEGSETELGNPVEVIRFKAVAPGWTDLTFDGGSAGTYRVKVD